MNAPILSFISPTTRLYLKDCLDHSESALSSIEMLAYACDKLVDYIFSKSGHLPSKLSPADHLPPSFLPVFNRLRRVLQQREHEEPYVSLSARRARGD